MAREHMTGVDTAWLRMDSPGNLMMINAVEVFDTPIPYDALADRVTERLLRFDRFKKKVVLDGAAYWWEDDEHFDLANHLKRDKLPAPGGDRELQALVGRLASEPLDPNRPLWEFRLVSNYKGTNALVVRIHHCIADGIALVNVTMSMADDWHEVQRPKVRAAADDSGDDPEHEGSHSWPLIEPISRSMVKAAEATGTALGASLQLANDPEERGALALVGGQFAKDAMKIALMASDSQTLLKGTPGGRKVVAWNDPLPLPEVKAVCKVLSVSVNDVLLSCVAGAIHRYLERHGDYTAGKEIRAMVPVNLRDPNAPMTMGNRFGLVPLEIPVGIPNPVERLYEVRRRMDELKSGYQGPLAYAILSAMGYTPKIVQKLLLDYLANKGTAVMTNVPGPTEAISVAGVKVRRLIPWVPQSGNIGVGISIYSYNGQVQFGLITDADLCAEPQLIIDEFAPEFERLLLTLSMLPREMVVTGRLDPVEVERRLLSGRAAAPRRVGAAGTARAANSTMTDKSKGTAKPAKTANASKAGKGAKAAGRRDDGATPRKAAAGRAAKSARGAATPGA
jgi:WS/DGAT/MGAT family acyltransferase